MRRYLIYPIIFALSLSSLLTSVTVAYALTLTTANSIGGLTIHSTRAPANATAELLVYTESLNFAVNQVVALTATLNGVAIVVPPPVASPRGFALLAPFPNVPTPTNRLVTSGIIRKPPGTIEDLTSSSTGTVAPIGKTDAQALISVNAARDAFLLAVAKVVNNFVAFGRVEDPLSFGPGDNVISDLISGIVLQADAGTIGSAFEVDAESTLPGLADLYMLTIFASPGLSSVNDLLIGFNSNPLLGLDDSAIVAALRSQFSVSGNTATMNGPVTLSYTLHASASYDLDHGVAAEAATAPEPGSPLLLGTGFVGLLVYRWRQRRRRT